MELGGERTLPEEAIADESQKFYTGYQKMKKDQERVQVVGEMKLSSL